jgi:hypothetical protein
MRYPRSGNANFPNDAPFWGAGDIIVRPGFIRRASPLGQVRAGSAIDLAQAAKFRGMGCKAEARDALLFARDARVLLTSRPL